MTFDGRAYALGAGTIINAIANWKGAAFGIDLKTCSHVELSPGVDGIRGTIEGLPGGDTVLIEKCVSYVLEHFGLEMGGSVRTRSEVPLASGLKSSSAAANATILATLDAIGEEMDALEAIGLGVRAARDAGVTITGAFDDACASFFGGVVVTDNKTLELVRREKKDAHVLILAPDRHAFSSGTNVARSKLIAPWVDMAYDLALQGDHEKAMTLNGFLYCNALGYDCMPMIQALEAGVQGVTLSGTGPAFIAIVDRDTVDALRDVWGTYENARLIDTQINNSGATKL